MLTIRIDEKRIYITGEGEFNFTVSPTNEMIVEAPEGVTFAVGGRRNRIVTTTSSAGSEGFRLEGRIPAAGEGSRVDPQVAGLESYAYLRAVLAHHGRPMSTAELTERVLAETAYQTEAADPQNTLRTALGRKPEMFSREKASSGETIWGLTEWAEIRDQ